MLSLEVEDDGRGIGEHRRGVGVGLTSMRERAEELGGSCKMEPGPSDGTRVSALLPFMRNEAADSEAGEPSLREA